MVEIIGKVLHRSLLSERIVSLLIGNATDGVLPDFDAGAHIEINLPSGGTRAYSLIAFDAEFSAPMRYQIAVQREEEGQGGSRYMHDLQVGDTLRFSAPKNDFPLVANTPALLLAGGIGVTPMISMACALREADTAFEMIFAGRSKSEMAHVDALREMVGKGLTLHFDESHGLLDLNEVINQLGERHLYVCGPRGMIDAVRVLAEAAKIAPERIHFELFEVASAGDSDTAFEVEINDGSVFTIPAGKSIIEVLEENDVDVMYDCQRGDCGICQCDVLAGEPDHRDVVLSEAERATGDVMQICVSRSKSPRLVLDIEGA